jgi:type I restriction enzyme, S subunit
MSGMNFLEKLLDGGAVEWKALGEVCRFINGKAYKQPELLDQGKYPVLRVGNFFTNGNWYYSNLELEEDKYCDRNDLLYAWSASFGPRIWDGDKVIYHYHIWKVVPDAKIIDKKYLYYLLDWDTKALKEEHGTGSTMMHVSKGSIEKRLVPIPCPENPEKSLAIQAEIVRILDTFTMLTAELTAELTDRKKQYNYYRDRLLTFEKGEVEWKPLGEVAKIQRGASPRPIAKYITDNEDGVPWIKIGDTSPGSKYVNSTAQRVTLEGAKKSRILDEGDFIISNSMSFGRPYILAIRGAIHDGWASISDFGGKLNSDYLYHYLSSNSVQNYWIGKINSGSVSNLNADIIKTLQIPIPALSEQERIVAILDKFDTLTTSISEGLPREIALRQKQYEYYRDLLLTFPKSEEVEV